MNIEWLKDVLLFLGPPLAAALTWWFTRPKQRAEVQKTLAEAGQVELKTKTDTADDIVEMSGKAAGQWKSLYEVMSNNNQNLKIELHQIEIRVDHLEQALARALNALHYLMNEVKEDYPEAVKVANEIANAPSPDDVIPAPQKK